MSAPSKSHTEGHYINRAGWLRAAVLGANDGLLSTSSLVVGVAAAGSSASQILLTGIAGLAAGSMSMAAGEFVSVSSQSDAEQSDLAREQQELLLDPEHETRELAAIYIKRGLDRDLAVTVAKKLMAKDALEAHARDELGLTDISAAKPVQAALASASSFALGAAPPILTALLVPAAHVIWAVFGGSLVVLAGLGAAGARAGGAPLLPGVARVFFWGAVAMAVTAGVGRLFNVTVG